LPGGRLYRWNSFLQPQYGPTAQPAGTDITNHPPQWHAGAKSKYSAYAGQADNDDCLKRDGPSVTVDITGKQQEQPAIKEEEARRCAGQILDDGLIR
jgi:hypothetical protein